MLCHQLFLSTLDGHSSSYLLHAGQLLGPVLSCSICHIDRPLVGDQDSLGAYMLGVAWTSLVIRLVCILILCISTPSSPAQPNLDEVCMTAAVLLEAVAEDIREYLRSRRDTIRCIVTMLTDDSAGANAEGETEGESLFEELKRTVADEVSHYSTCTSWLLTRLMQLTCVNTHANSAELSFTVCPLLLVLAIVFIQVNCISCICNRPHPVLRCSKLGTDAPGFWTHTTGLLQVGCIGTRQHQQVSAAVSPLECVPTKRWACCGA